MKKLKPLLMLFLIAGFVPITMHVLNSTSDWNLIGIRDEDLSLKETTVYGSYDDTYAQECWGVFTVGAHLAHAVGINGTNSSNPSNPVVVAVLDSGIDYTHPDLDDNYQSGGYDFVNSDSDPMDDNGHGTHCAGIIAAEMNNGLGVVGIAPCAKVMAWKVLDADGSGEFSYVTDAIWDIVNNWSPKEHVNGVDIISMSIGGYLSGSELTQLQNAITAAVNEGIILFAAAGNDATTPVDYPARISNVVAITAIGVLQELASYSNYGFDVEYTAPGGDWMVSGLVQVGILSTVPGGYDSYCGTSMACPAAAGVAALFAGQLGSASSPANIKQNLTDNAKDLGLTGPDTFYGYGLVQIMDSDFNYTTWFHQHYDDDILLTYFMMYGDLFSPRPPIDWVTIAIIAGIAGFFAIVAAASARRGY